MAKLTASTPGDLVRQARVDAGLTREQLAYRSGISVSTVARLELENRVPSLKILAILCELINVPIADVASALKQASAA